MSESEEVLARVVRAREAVEDGEAELAARLLADLEADLAASAAEADRASA